MNKFIATLMAVLSLASFNALAQTPSVSTPTLTQRGSPLAGATAQAFTFWNEGTGTSFYVITDNADWLSVSPTSGSSTGDFDTITVTYVTTNLVPGATSNATISIVQTNGIVSTQQVAVTLIMESDVTRGTAVGNAVAVPTNSIAIGDQAGLAVATAEGAIQIGPGVNSTANTIQWGSINLASGLNYQPYGSVAFTGKVLTAFAYNNLTNVVLTYREVIVISNRISSIGAATTVTNSF